MLVLWRSDGRADMGPERTVRRGAVARWGCGGPDQGVDMGMEKQGETCKTFKRWGLVELHDG